MDQLEIKTTIEELLNDLGFSSSITLEQEGEDWRATIDAATDNPLLIGFHGDNLSSLQTIVNLTLFRKLNSPLRVTLDVGSYRKEREEKIKQIAVGAADRARFLDRPVELSPMKAEERRLVHLYVSQLPGVASESTGEGRERRVVVRPAGKT